MRYVHFILPLGFLFLGPLQPSSAKAEYRVFLLKIAKKTAARTPAATQKPQAESQSQDSAQDFRLVESTLDPVQYRYYYSVAADEEVTYTATWRCRGRTDNFKPHCPNPKDLAKDQIPSENKAQP